ncbi:Pentatricopeptide repeat [Dillenia turbinata]|uniref:Pentatricopeptide repeat n=1 Tax=Dillenia turbinata TaxID=194707 RepID=A0AAN8Z9T9_9MAGN
MRPRSFLHYPTLFPFSFRQNLTWVSSITTQICSSQFLTHPELHSLQAFSNGSRERRNKDYELTIVSALKFCSSPILISQGQQIHSLILKSGLDSNVFVKNSLINLYSKCGLFKVAESMFDSSLSSDPVSCNIMLAGYVNLGQLGNARKLFDVMPVKGCVSYTTMIMGLARNNFWVEAVEVFKDMRFAGVVPNEVTLGSVISAYAHLCGSGSHVGGMLHGVVIRVGLEGLNLISTNLVHVYCVCSSLGDARLVFDEMGEKNIVGWNVMLNGYSKGGLVDLARDLFERIPDRDVVSWGTIIGGYVQVERLDEALTVFTQMQRSGLGPNDIMIVDLVSACGRAMLFSEGQQLHGAAIRRGLDCYDFVQSTIIHFYSVCGKISLACLQFEQGSKNHVASWNSLIAGFIRNGIINQARNLFDEMPERDVFSWSSMIAGHAQNEEPNMALELFHCMIDNGIRPNEVTMVSILSAIASLGTLNEGVWAHEFIVSNSIPLNDNLSAALIDMYGKCGSFNSALEFFYQIQAKTSTISPWNAIICGLAMHGHANLALKIFSDLQRTHIKPNSITFIGVLTACCHVGLKEEGEKHFKSMKIIYDIEPNIKHYGCMVDLLGRAGQLEQAEEMIRNMPMKADVVIWGTLLAASRTHGNVDIGERAAENLARLEPSHGPGRVLLSNLYADAGRWDDAFLVRRAIQSGRMSRVPGCSGVV